MRDSAARVWRLFFGICLIIGALVMIEVGALWLIGAKYKPRSAIHEARVIDFSLSADGRWGASRIHLDRAAVRPAPEWAILLHDMQRLDRTVRLDVGRYDLESAAISPTGDHVAFTTHDGAVGLLSRHRMVDPLRIIGRFRHEISDLAWSPDSQYLVAVGGKSHFLWTMSSEELLHKFSYSGGTHPSLSFARDSRTLLSVGDDGALNLWDVSSGKLAKTIPVPNRVSSTALSSDGKFAAFTTDTDLFVWNVEHEKELWRRNISPSWLRKAVALSADDTLVASIEREANGDTGWIDRAVIRHARTGQLVYSLDLDVAHIIGILFAPDGTLCCWDDKGLIVGWDVKARSEVWRFSCLDWLSSSSAFNSRVVGPQIRVVGKRKPPGVLRVSSSRGFIVSFYGKRVGVCVKSGTADVYST